jgi:IS5 family transposase
LAVQTVPRRSVASDLSQYLDSPELGELIAELDDLRWTGRKGYGSRALIGACLVKSLYAIPTWSRTAALIAEHSGLQDALGAVPSVYAMYRFATKLRENRPTLDACFTAMAVSLRRELPDYGQDTAIDSSDMPAYANGQRFLTKNGPERERYSDPDASWGHRSAVSTRKGGGFYGYKLHAAVCARTDLPLAWRVESANHGDALFALPLLDAVRERGFIPVTCAMDKGYDSRAIHDAFEERDCHPIIAQIRQHKATTRDDVPVCEHGRWTFAGADFKRKLTKWRCPHAVSASSGQLRLACSPASVWIKADRRNPLIPRSTRRFGDLYRGRGAVERCFGRLKHEYALTPLRTRGIDWVQLHADLTILATLAQALARARAIPLAA